MGLRVVGVLMMIAAFIATGSAAGHAQGTRPVALFLTLPMTNGFADATDALVETQALVREALESEETVRLVGRLQDSQAVLTVLGRGTGYVELTAALQDFDADVVSTPVMLRANDRYIEAMLSVGSCGDAATNPSTHSTSTSCYRKIVVGLGGHDVRQGAAKGVRNPWAGCAGALARDVRAWVTQNATRLATND